MVKDKLNENKKEKEIKKFTLGIILSWIFGIFFGIGGLGALFSGMTISGISYILISLILLPPMNNIYKKKFNFQLSGILKITLVIILFVIGGVNMTNNSSKINENYDSNINSEAEAISSCIPDWSCSTWAECSNEGTQTRSCTDSNDCNTLKNKPSTTQKCEYVYKIGDSIQAGQFSWKVTNFYKTSKIGESFYGTFLGQKADGVFIVLSVEVTNTGKSAQYLMDSFLKLVDEKGREFSPDSTAAIYLDSNKALMFDNVNPGITKKGNIIYDVPTDVNSFSLRISSNLVADSFSSLKFSI